MDWPMLCHWQVAKQSTIMTDGFIKTKWFHSNSSWLSSSLELGGLDFSQSELWSFFSLGGLDFSLSESWSFFSGDDSFFFLGRKAGASRRRLSSCWGMFFIWFTRSGWVFHLRLLNGFLVLDICRTKLNSYRHSTCLLDNVWWLLLVISYKIGNLQ